MREINAESMQELREIFNVTGGTEFMNHIEQCSRDKAKETGTDLEESYFLKTYMENSNNHQ